MACDNNLDSYHARDDFQGMEVLRASLLTQDTKLRALAENLDHRFKAFEWRFDEIVTD